MNCPGTVILQALAIYLGVLQNIGKSKSAWFLNGVLIRLAVSMNFHRDGLRFPDLTTLEIELRRRLWWQICLIDSRSEGVKDPGYKLSENMFDTEMPNKDDAGLHSAMSIRHASDKWTSTTIFCLLCEIWKLSRQLQFTKHAKHTPRPNVDEVIDLFQQSQARIEDVYLRHLDPSQPLHSFMATSVRLFLTKVDVILHSTQHPTRAAGSPPTESFPSNKILHSSISIISYTYALQKEPS